MTALPAPHFEAARRLRPLVIPALFVPVGIALGGVPGFLIVFAAAAVAVDRALDFGGTSMVGASDAFRRARRGRSRGDLPYLADDAGWAAVAPRRRLGVQTIAIDSIVGTVDRKKAEAFDRAFRPPEWRRGRWTQMYHAARGGTEMQPVSV